MTSWKNEEEGAFDGGAAPPPVVAVDGAAIFWTTFWKNDVSDVED